MPFSSQELGMILRNLRKQAQLNQKEIARLIKKSRYYIIRIEKGEISNLPFNTVLNYLKACNISWGKFFSKLEALENRKEKDEVIAKTEPFHRFPRKKSKRVKRFGSKKRLRLLKGFARYQAIITRIEQGVQEFLNKSGVSSYQYPVYKVCARKYYKIFTKYKAKEQLEKNLARIEAKWIKKGYDPEILKRVKEIVSPLPIEGL